MPFLNLRMVGIDQEAIAFQVGHKLPGKLDALFQKCIDYRESLAGQKGKAKKVDTFARAAIKTELPIIVHDEIGFNINKIEFSPQPSGFVGISVNLRGDGAIDTMARLKEATDSNDTLSKIFMRSASASKFKPLAQLLDLETSKIKPIKTTKKDVMSATFFFDIWVLCLVQEVVGVQFETLSAKEITSIVLHEIGHFVAAVEISNNEFFRQQTLQKLIINIANTDNVALKEDMADELTVIASQVAPNDIRLKSANKIKDKLNQLKHEFKDDTQEAQVAYFKLLFGYILYVNLIIGAYWWMKSTWMYGPSQGKTGDVLKTWDNKIIIERQADQFAARMGYGSYLISALDKVVSATKQTAGFVGINVSSTVKTKPSWVGMNMLKLAYTMGNYITQDASGYDEARIREQRIKKFAAEILRQNDLPDSVVKKTLEELDAIDQQLDRNKRSPVSAFADEVVRFTVKTTSPVALIHTLVNGKLAIEYEKLHTQLSNLINNPLFETAARFQQLSIS